jgi:hypothetical protein
VTPVTVITGASSGIGAELARVFSRNCHTLALVARRGPRLDALAAELAQAAAPDATDRLATALAAHEAEPQFIVNNAGFGLIGHAADLPHDEQLNMIDLNVRALTELSLAFVDSLARHRGGILNVGSLGGFMPGPGSAVYYASKAYVLSLTEALHRELNPRGIRVCCLCPGPVPSEFQARSGVPQSVPHGPLATSAQRVAKAGYHGLMCGQRVVIPGAANWLMARLVAPLLPRALLLKLLDDRQTRRQG